MSMAEFDLIKKYFCPENNRQDVILAAGDDCAIVDFSQNNQPNCHAVAITTDTLISGTHFPVDTSAEDIACKVLAVNLSDLAAMGADPAWVCLSLTLPEVDHHWLEAFSNQFKQILAAMNIALIGGDTTRGPLSITLQAMGFLSTGRSMQRSQAKVGDKIFVTGTLGDAAVGLYCVQNKIQDESLAACVLKLNRPQARNQFALSLVQHCDCAIDISDGLLADLGHILSASDKGAHLNLADMPVSNAVRYYFNQYGNNQIDWSMILSHGDDYELCFTVAQEEVTNAVALAETQQVKLSCIGEITEQKQLRCFDEKNKIIDFPVSGYLHF